MLLEEQIDIQIVNSEEGYRLDLNGIELDVEEWERQLLEAPPITEATVELHQGISQVYVGDHHGDYHYLWAEPEKTRLRSLMLVHAKQLASYYMDNQQEEKAHYSRIQSLLPHEEHLYFELMRLYDRIQDRFLVEKQYELLVTMLRQEFDVELQPVVQVWFKEWKNKLK
ncbi:MAG: histidine kinase [Paenibacillus sp.]|jgi:two-component SAPR family response regulator|nr:histidine kinase [Paenibacillus sp.]